MMGKWQDEQRGACSAFLIFPTQSRQYCAMKLVPIELPRSPATPHGGSIWINPQHIVSVRPLTRGSAPTVTLTVEVKLEGMPLFIAPLGNFSTEAEATVEWARFLSTLVDVDEG
jgi:hypothetical protein